MNLKKIFFAIIFFYLTSFHGNAFAVDVKRCETLAKEAKNYDPGSVLAKNKANEAIFECSRIISIDPNASEAWFWRGFAYLVRRDSWFEVIRDNTEVIRRNPNDIDALNNRGMAYASIKEYTAALTDLNQALIIDPEFFDAFMTRGYVYSTLGKPWDAFADYSSALNINPQYATAYYNRGLICDYLQLHKEAVVEYSLAGGLSKMELNQFIEAIAYFDKAIKWQPTSSPAYVFKGICYEKTGNSAQALMEYRASLKYDTSSKIRQIAESGIKRLGGSSSN